MLEPDKVGAGTYGHPVLLGLPPKIVIAACSTPLYACGYISYFQRMFNLYTCRNKVDWYEIGSLCTYFVMLADRK